MRKYFVVLLFMVLSANATILANVKIEGGFFAGLRTVNDAEIKRVYGGGFIYFPYLDLEIFKGLTVGGGYEFGYSKTGKIGLFDEIAKLDISGFELFLMYQYRAKILVPTLSVGLGFFSYKQAVESASAQPLVDFKKTTVIFAGGLKIYPMDSFFFSIEAKYVPLKVQPYEDVVDLGGWRFAVGFGGTFGFK